MSVKVISRNYYNQFHTTSDPTNWLIGNVGDWQRVSILFEVAIEFIATNSETVSIDSLNNVFKLNNGKSWQDYGFDIGDEILFLYSYETDFDNDGEYSKDVRTETYNIKNIVGSKLEVEEDLNFDFNIVPTDRGNIKIQGVRFSAPEKEPEGVKFRYSHLTNDAFDSGNLSSLIDGTITEFIYPNLKDLTENVPTLMQAIGFQSGMAISKCTVKKVNQEGNTNNAVIYQLAGGNQTFDLKVIHIIQFGINTVFFGRVAYSIPINQVSGGSLPGFKNQERFLIPIEIVWSTGQANVYKNGDVRTLFIYNSPFSGIKYLRINVRFKVNSAIDTDPTDYLRLRIFKYINDTSLTKTDEVIEVQRWNNASALVGQTLEYNDIVALSINEGDSYSLAFEYLHDPVVNSERGIVFEVFWTAIEVIDNGDGSNTSAFTYQIDCDYMLASFFEDVSNIENKKAPSSVYDANSLTDNFEIEMFPVWNNPNTVIKNVLSETQRLGNTGWFDENYNGRINNYRVSNKVYKTTDGSVLNALDFTKPVVFECEIDDINGLSNGLQFTFGFAWIPSEEDFYKDLKTPFHENLFINTTHKFQNSLAVLQDTGATIFEGDGINGIKMNFKAHTGVMINRVSDNPLQLSVELIPNAEFTAYFNSLSEDNRNYILWLSIGDARDEINFTDRVSLLLDYNTLEKQIVPVGPLPGMVNYYIEHPQKSDTALAVEQYKGHIEDDILTDTFFTLKKEEQTVLSMTVGYEVVNTDTQAYYELETYPINTSNFIKDQNNIQQINVDEIRGFKLVEGNNKNWVKLARQESIDTPEKAGYRLLFATKIRWEDWLERLDVPTEFFNVNKENNGYNNNWLDYLRNEGNYAMNFYVLTTVSENGEVLTYKNQYPLTFNGYDENTNIETQHVYYRHADNTVLNIGEDPETGKPLGVLLQNEFTRIEITYTNLTGEFDIDKLYCVTSLEIDKGPGEFEYRQISSVWEVESDNPLRPLPGENNLLIQQIAPNIVKAICLVEPSLLQDAIKYKITGRIGCYEGGNDGNPTDPTNETGIYENAYEGAYE